MLDLFKKIINILEAFLDKHFLTSLFSFISSLIIYSLMTSDAFLIQKLGKNLFIVGTFCLILFVVELSAIIYRKTRDGIYYNKQRKVQKKIEESEIENHLFELTHSLSQENIKYIYYLLENKNKPLIMRCFFRDYGPMNIICEFYEFMAETYDIIPLNPISLKSEKKLKKGEYATQLILKDEYYNYFMLLKKKYGKITKFE